MFEQCSKISLCRVGRDAIVFVVNTARASMQSARCEIHGGRVRPARVRSRCRPLGQVGTAIDVRRF